MEKVSRLRGPSNANAQNLNVKKTTVNALRQDFLVHHNAFALIAAMMIKLIDY